MAIKYMLEGNCMKLVGDSDDVPEGTPLVQVFAHEEFDRDVIPKLDRPIVAQSMSRALACHADLFDTCTTGVILIPNKQHLLEPPRATAFYIDDTRLIIVDDTTESTDELAIVAKIRRRTPLTLARVLFFLLENLLVDDAVYLENFEGRLEITEESIADMEHMKANHAITSIRRELLRLDYYYEQMESIGDLLEDNANDLFSKDDARLFGIFDRHADRLFDRTRTLKEYSLQLFELQQTQLDIKQNETMRWLTVVTSIFVPLTLVTSWYGMNFQTMPELGWQWSYPLVIMICLIIVVVELIYFKHRNWL